MEITTRRVLNIAHCRCCNLSVSVPIGHGLAVLMCSRKDCDNFGTQKGGSMYAEPTPRASDDMPEPVLFRPGADPDVPADRRGAAPAVAAPKAPAGLLAFFIACSVKMIECLSEACRWEARRKDVSHK